MIADEKPDDLLRALASLSSPAPAAARDARIRARCHAALTRREPRSSRARLSRLRVFRPASSLLDAVLTAAVGVYGIVIVAEALKAAGLF